ncbi:MAG: hypothetical protein M5U19_23340 [Microthrixaceae bacterium]|nr:hypothetical protein [Microthrixaceae bacterium]
MFALLEPLLNRVQRPARYIGCEVGAVEPDWSKCHGPGGDAVVRWLLAYPDTYEIGQPNQGLQVLFEILNERPDALAERTYAPWVDLESEMRAAGVPLFSVDTHRAADSFHVLAFNLSAELTYTNLLNMVDLAGVPVRADERGSDHPVVIAGGHCTYNPEPLADFLDAVVLGDGEEAVADITAAMAAWLAAGSTDREDLLRSLCGIEGVYVPAAYEVTYSSDEPDAVVEAVEPLWAEAPEVVSKRTIPDLAEWPYPRSQMVPLTEVVHDRLNVEVFRGCTRGCRFCQAGMVTRPVRGASRRAGGHDGRRGSGQNRVRRGGAHLAVHSRLLGYRPDRRRHRRRRHRGSPVGVAAVSQSGRVRSRHRRSGAEGPPHRTHLRPGGGHMADAPGDQQAHRRRGPLQRGRQCLLTGLAQGEALLPHRTPDRDRRGHPRHRGDGGELRGHRSPPFEEPVGDAVGGRVRAEALHSVPVVRPEHRAGAPPQDRAPA